MAAGIQLQISIADDEPLIGALNRLYLKTLSMRRPFNQFGEVLLTATHEHFSRQESPDGTPWKPLSPVTIAMRDRKEWKKGGAARRRRALQILEGGTDDKALFVTGHMEGSITYRADDTMLALGSNRTFKGGSKSALAIHQLGGKAGRGRKVTIPARPFLGINELDKAALLKITSRYLED